MFSPSTLLARKIRASQAGFSLVEVVLAVGVVAFAFVAILGLIPAGLSQFRQAMDISVCSQISQRIIMEAQQTEFDVLVANAGTAQFRYFDEQGNEVPVTDAAKENPAALSADQKLLTVYHVNTRIRPATSLPGAVATTPTIATLTIEVAFNPGNRRLVLRSPVSDPNAQSYPLAELINTDDPANRGVSIKTYSAQIGRNQ